jgi:predicted nuclease of restriction endonuclease-like (RecB) superfamily
MKVSKSNTLYRGIKAILQQARQTAYRSVNFAMVVAYWEVGRRIVQHEQQGKTKAGYGEQVLQDLSEKLTRDFGTGFSITNLKYFRQFYLSFPASRIGHTLRDELSWSHYRLLMRVNNPDARRYYIEEAIAQNWSTRALERQINSFYYERIIASKNKKKTSLEAKKNAAALALSPEDFIKDPFVLEFLNIHAGDSYLEKDLETAIISKLQFFLLELGKGFSFVARQKRISAEDDYFYVDLDFIITFSNVLC